MLPARGAQVRQRRVHDVVERHHLLLEVLAERGRLDPADVQLVHQRARRVHERVHAPELARRHRRRTRRWPSASSRSTRTVVGAPARGLDVGRDRTRGVLVAAVEHARRRCPARPRSRHTAAPRPPLPPVTTATPGRSPKSFIEPVRLVVDGSSAVAAPAAAVALGRDHQLLLGRHDVRPLAHRHPAGDAPLAVAPREAVDVAEAGGEVAAVVVGRIAPVVRHAVGLAARVSPVAATFELDRAGWPRCASCP